MLVKEYDELNNWLKKHLLKQGIQPFDWATYLEEERIAEQARLSQMTLDKQNEEFLKKVEELDPPMSEKEYLICLNKKSNIFDEEDLESYL